MLLLLCSPEFDLMLLVGVKEGLWIAISDQFTFSCFNGLLLMFRCGADVGSA